MLAKENSLKFVFFSKQCSTIVSNSSLPTNITFETENRLSTFDFSTGDFIKFIKDTQKAFGDFKYKQKCVWNNDFWYAKVYIFWKCLQYTIHCDKTQMLKKFLSDKINGTNNVLFFSFASSNSSQF